MKLRTINKRGSRLEKLKALADVLSSRIDDCIDEKTLPSLAKQYRETVREIEEIEGATEDNDEIADILKDRESDGKPGSVR